MNNPVGNSNDESVKGGMSRRGFLGRGAAVGAGVVLASPLLDSVLGGVAGASTYSGTLKVGLTNADTAGVGPIFGKMDAAGFAMLRAIYDPLMVNDRAGVPQPFLAQSMTSDASHKVWTITLRSGIKFHDGSPLNADALIANINAWVNPKAIASYAAAPLVANPKTKKAVVAKIDALTVKITLNFPWVSFPNTLAEQQIGFVQAPACVAANIASGGSGDKNPVGTGPFVFDRCNWGVNDVIYLDANPNYWIAGLPNVAHVQFYPIVVGSSRMDALSGSVDLAVFNEAAQIGALRRNASNYNYMDDSNPSGYAVRLPAVDCVQFNCRHSLTYKGSPFANYDAKGKPTTKGLLARKAVCEAINRAAVNAIVNGGVCNDANQVFPTKAIYGKSLVAFPAYSATKAKADAKAAGLTKFNLMAVAGSGAQAAAAQAIQQFCSQIGVTVTVVYTDQSTLINNALTGSYDASLWSQFGGCDPDLNFPWWTTLDGANNSFISINMAGNFDPKIEAGMLAGMAAGTPKSQYKTWNGVMSQLNADLPYAWLNYQVSAIVSNKNVTGWMNPSVSVGGKTINLLAQSGTVPWLSMVTIS